MAVTIDGTNGITSPDFEPSGSTTPTNGLFLPAANTVGLATGSTERLRIDSSGNLGLGVTPSGWASSKAIEIGALGNAIVGFGAGDLELVSGAYYNGGYKYSATGTPALSYQIYNGAYLWKIAPSGTAGAAISFTQAMTLDASGNLGVGTTSPGARLDVYGGTVHVASGGTIKSNGYLVDFSSAQQSVGISFSTSSPTAFLDLYAGGDPVNTGGWSGAIRFLTGGTNALGTERARIDSSGNLLVAQTSASYTTLGASIRANGAVNSASASDFWNAYSTAAGAYRFYVTNAGTVYATSTTIAAISDQRLKENIRDLDDGLATILALKPRKFDWKEGKGKDIKDDRGFIAQEFEQVFPDLVDTWKDEPPEGEEPYKAVRPDLIPVLVKAIQELTARLEALEAK